MDANPLEQPTDAPTEVATGKKARRQLRESTRRIPLVISGVFILVFSVGGFYLTSDAFDKRTSVLVAAVDINKGDVVSPDYFTSDSAVMGSIPHIPYSADAPLALSGLVATQPIPMGGVVLGQSRGARIVAYPDEDSWHKAAVEWWVAVASESAPLRVGGVPEIPVLWPGAEDEGTAAQLDRAAQGVEMRTEQDRVFVTAQSPGWVWLRVPWDPWWFAPDGVPLKGGPGHLVVWADTGTTELRWDVPDNVDLLAVSLTVLALLLLIPMTSINRRRGWELDPDRPRPAAAALTRLADTTDRALFTAARTIARKPKPSPTPDPDSAPDPQPGSTSTRDAAGPDPTPTPASDPDSASTQAQPDP